MTYHKIHPIKTYIPVGFNRGTGWSSLCLNLVLEHAITPERNPAPLSSHTQCHFPGPWGPPVFSGVCRPVAGLPGLAERRVCVVTLARSPGFSLLSGMQCFLLKRISFNLLTAFCFSEGLNAQVTRYPRRRGARGIWKLGGSSAPGPGSPFAAGSLVWGTFSLSPLPKAIKPLPPSSLAISKPPFRGERWGGANPSIPQTQRASCGPSFPQPFCPEAALTTSLIMQLKSFS